MYITTYVDRRFGHLYIFVQRIFFLSRKILCRHFIVVYLGNPKLLVSRPQDDSRLLFVFVHFVWKKLLVLILLRKRSVKG
jgi:hypothetical protein